MHPSQPDFSYISILPSFCPSFGFTPGVECWGMAATIGMIVPDLFGRFEGYLSPSMSLAGRSTIEGTLSCFYLDHHQSSIINHHHTNKKANGFVAKKKQLLTEPRSLKFSDVPCTIEARILFFFCRWPAKNVSNQLIVSVDLINLYQFCLFVSIHFHSGYLSCIFFSISGEGPKTFPTVPDCPFDSDHEHFPWNLQQQQEVSQVPKVVIFGAIHVDLCRD